MKTQDIANRLYELCQKGQFDIAQKELFANDAVSIEPYDTPDFPRETKGLDAILEKGKKFDSLVTVNALHVEQPIVVDNAIAMKLQLDSTMKNDGKRSNMGELCVYEVKDGKIASERFYV
jgi:ketosteroid isomerase-like protein